MLGYSLKPSVVSFRKQDRTQSVALGMQVHHSTHCCYWIILQRQAKWNDSGWMIGR